MTIPEQNNNQTPDISTPASLHKMKIRQEHMLLQKNNSVSEGL